MKIHLSPDVCSMAVFMLLLIYCLLLLQLYVVDLYRGSYMGAHVLLNLLNELGKRDKM